MIYLVINNLILIQENIHLVENIKLFTDLNKQIFIVAGWIHDLGKLIDKPNHHIESLKFLNEFLELYPKYEGINEEIKDCILNHRTNGEPKTIYGEIFKLADKVSLRNKDWIQWKTKFKD